MINGKFYTGLPPKMVERQCGSGQNRQESHFFWPDDTQVDSSVETRVKRRGSLQGGAVSSTASQRQPAKADAAPDVDTRQMFHKEFAKSSIQFHDNLQASSGSQSRLNRARREVTPKLTDVSPQQQLPLLAIKEEQPADPSAARRKQAYSSKIEFYDYVNLNEPNNVRRPKMDMNNKREVELNSKNSPKLQVKHNVRHLSMERERERELPVVTKKPLNDGRHLQREQYDEEQEQQPVQLPKKILKPQRSKPWREQDEGESMLDFVDNGVRQLRLRSPAPMKKHVTYNEEAAEYAYYDDEGRQPNMRTGSAQQQHQQRQQQRQQQQQQQHKQPRQTAPYGETGRDTKSLNNYNKNYNNNYDSYNNNSSSSSSNYYNSNYSQSNSNYNYNQGNSNNSSNNYYDSSNNSNNNSRSRKILPKLPEPTTTATSATTTTATTARTMRSRRFDEEGDAVREETRAEQPQSQSQSQPSPSDPRKHLRSSLCFNGDALVVNVGAAAAASSTSSAAGLARRSSAGQRVSVGLPD